MPFKSKSNPVAKHNRHRPQVVAAKKGKGSYARKECSQHAYDAHSKTSSTKSDETSRDGVEDASECGASSKGVCPQA